MVAKRNDNMLARLALQVATGRTLSGAARDLGVDLKTAQSWARLEIFQAKVTRNRNAIVDRTVGKLVKLSVKAVETMGKLLDSQNEHIRLSAAKNLMDKLLEIESHAAQSRQLAKLQDQIASLTAMPHQPTFNLEPTAATEEPAALEGPATPEADDDGTSHRNADTGA